MYTAKPGTNVVCKLHMWETPGIEPVTSDFTSVYHSMECTSFILAGLQDPSDSFDWPVTL